MQGSGSNPTFTAQTFDNRFTDFQSIDAEVLGYGTSNTEIAYITHPVQLNGFLTVLMAEQDINVSLCFFQMCWAVGEPTLGTLSL